MSRLDVDFVALISTVGFPIVAYLLLFFKISGNIEKNTEAINGLKEVIAKLCASILEKG